MKYAQMGLCEGRHQMPVEEYIFLTLTVESMFHKN